MEESSFVLCCHSIANEEQKVKVGWCITLPYFYTEVRVVSDECMSEIKQQSLEKWYKYRIYGSGINKYRASQKKVDDIYGVYWHDNIRGFSNVLTSVIVDSTEFEFYLK